MDDDRNMKMLLKSIAQTIREEERTGVRYCAYG